MLQGFWEKTSVPSAWFPVSCSRTRSKRGWPGKGRRAGGARFRNTREEDASKEKRDFQQPLRALKTEIPEEPWGQGDSVRPTSGQGKTLGVGGVGAP